MKTKSTTNTAAVTTTKPTIDPLAAIRARALEIAASTPRGGKKTPKECRCGCGQMTAGGTWRPGHDAKALSAMLAEMRNPKPAPVIETEATPADFAAIDAALISSECCA